LAPADARATRNFSIPIERFPIRRSRPVSGRWLALPALAVAALLGLAFWWHLGLPQDLVDAPPGKIHCVSYTPFRGNQTPFDHDLHVPAWQIEQDLALLAPVTDCVRLYATDQGLDQVLPVAQKYGIKVLVGAWIGRDPEANERQLSDVIRLANEYPDTVRAIIVGNEVLLRGEQTPDTLAAMLARVRQATGKPVTYADVWEFWLKAPELANAVDFVTIHILPYWEDQPQPVEAGLDHLKAVLGKVRAAMPGKPILVGETGWPSAGRERENAAPGLVNQARYLREFMAYVAADGADLDYNLIEAFDQPWKRALEGTVGGYWGLFDANRQPKFPWRGPVSEDASWPTHFGISTALAVLLLGAAGLRGYRASPAGWLTAAMVAEAAGTALVLQARHSWLAAMTWHEYATEALLLLASAGSAWMAFRAVAAQAPQPVVAPLANALAWLGRPRLRSLDRPLLLALLQGAAVVGALAVSLGLVFDPRYRDFPVAAFFTPAVTFAWLSLAGSGRPAHADAREEALLGALLFLAGLTVAVREGPLNLVAFDWMAVAVLLAAPWLPALRALARRTVSVSAARA
jgi:exo-beta-1,3-glucanase (GH17 family)